VLRFGREKGKIGTYVQTVTFIDIETGTHDMSYREYAICFQQLCHIATAPEPLDQSDLIEHHIAIPTELLELS